MYIALKSHCCTISRAKITSIPLEDENVDAASLVVRSQFSIQCCESTL